MDRADKQGKESGVGTSRRGTYTSCVRDHGGRRYLRLLSKRGMTLMSILQDCETIN